MKKLLLLTLLSYFALNLHAQDSARYFKPVFKKGYLRLGFNKLGGDLDNQLSPLQNIKKGNYGGGYGYNLEFGHIFYFLNRHQPRLANVGMDWTILSFAYSPLNNWKDYSAPAKPEGQLDGSAFSGAITSKLGPVVAFNPADKLVIEARVQLTYGIRTTSLDYYAEQKVPLSSGDFDYDESYTGFDNEKFLDGRGFGSSIGATVRYGFIGFSIDYENAKIPTTYYSKEFGGTEVYTTEKLSYKNLQFKLSFSL